MAGGDGDIGEGGGGKGDIAEAEDFGALAGAVRNFGDFEAVVAGGGLDFEAAVFGEEGAGEAAAAILCAGFGGYVDAGAGWDLAGEAAADGVQGLGDEADFEAFAVGAGGEFDRFGEVAGEGGGEVGFGLIECFGGEFVAAGGEAAEFKAVVAVVLGGDEDVGIGVGESE